MRALDSMDGSEAPGALTFSTCAYLFSAVSGWAGASSERRHRIRNIRDEMAVSLIAWTFGSRSAHNPITMPARHGGHQIKWPAPAIQKKGGIAMATSKKAKKTTRKLTAKKLEATKPLVVVGGWNRVKN
jgi:hypothetical protein